MPNNSACQCETPTGLEPWSAPAAVLGQACALPVPRTQHTHAYMPRASSLLCALRGRVGDTGAVGHAMLLRRYAPHACTADDLHGRSEVAPANE